MLSCQVRICWPFCLGSACNYAPVHLRVGYSAIQLPQTGMLIRLWNFNMLCSNLYLGALLTQNFIGWGSLSHSLLFPVKKCAIGKLYAPLLLQWCWWLRKTNVTSYTLKTYIIPGWADEYSRSERLILHSSKLSRQYYSFFSFFWTSDSGLVTPYKNSQYEISVRQFLKLDCWSNLNWTILTFIAFLVM